MTAQEIREKLEKAQEVVAKKEGTLKKHEAKAEKLRKQIIARGWDLNKDRYQKADTEEHHDCYWTFCDYSHALDDIERTKKVIEEKKAIVAKWADKEAEAKKVEAEKEMFPEILKDFQQSVIDMWDRWDLNRRERLRAEYKKMEEEDTDRLGMGAYKAFIKKYTYRAYEFAFHTSTEEIHKENVRHSEILLKNLWNRVKEKVGEATDWAGLYVTQGNEWEGAVVNGVVKGTKGTAYVETIGAGGWNIQKFHYRTLVK